MAISNEDRNSLLEWCLKEKLGEFWDWEKPLLGHTVGPCDPNAYDTFETELTAVRTAISAQLADFSEQELMALKHQYSGADKELATHWKSSFRDELMLLKKMLPARGASGFGHPFYVADFKYWGQMEHLSLHEAVLLSLGIEPSRIEESRIYKLKKSKDQLLPAYQYLLKRHDQFIRFFPHGVGGFGYATPRFLKSKFDELDLEVHPDFYTQLKKRVAASSRGRAKPAQTELTGQERQSALKLIAAMSCEQYSFNPKANRNDSTKRIQEDLAAVGLSLDNKTILKWLKDAADLVDKDYWSED